MIPLSWCQRSQVHTRTLLCVNLRVFILSIKRMFFVFFLPFVYWLKSEKPKCAQLGERWLEVYIYIGTNVFSQKTPWSNYAAVQSLYLYFYSFHNVKNYCCFVHIMCTMFPEGCSQIGILANHADPVCLNEEPQAQYHLIRFSC